MASIDIVEGNALAKQTWIGISKITKGVSEGHATLVIGVGELCSRS
jgi:hypothetical protein